MIRLFPPTQVVFRRVILLFLERISCDGTLTVLFSIHCSNSTQPTTASTVHRRDNARFKPHFTAMRGEGIFTNCTLWLWSSVITQQAPVLIMMQWHFTLKTAGERDLSEQTLTSRLLWLIVSLLVGFLLAVVSKLLTHTESISITDWRVSSRGHDGSSCICLQLSLTVMCSSNNHLSMTHNCIRIKKKCCGCLGNNTFDKIWNNTVFQKRQHNGALHNCTRNLR